MSAIINCCSLFNVSVLKARKLHEGMSCLGKNTSELDPLRTVSPEWGGIVQISVPGKISLYFLPDCQGQNKPRASCWEMTTDQMGSLAMSTWREPYCLREKHTVPSETEAEVLTSHSQRNSSECVSFCTAQRSAGAEWAQRTQPRPYASHSQVLRWTSVQAGMRSDENRKISRPWVCRAGPVLQDSELSTSQKHRSFLKPEIHWPPTGQSPKAGLGSGYLLGLGREMH